MTHPPRRPRPTPKKQWTAFGPTDRSQLDASAVVAGAEAARARLEGIRATLEKRRHGGARKPTGDDDPDHPHPHPAPRRADELVPFLLIRTLIGDIGVRPIEPTTLKINYRSPDILLATPLPRGSPSEPTVRDRAQVDASFTSRVMTEPALDTTYDVWIHVWNLGRAAAFGVRVRAWAQIWGGQGIPPAPGEYIGGQRLDLGDRTSETSHRVVKVGQVRLPGYDYAGIWATAECITDVSQGTTEDALTSVRAGETWLSDDPFKDRHTARLNVWAGSPWSP